VPLHELREPHAADHEQNDERQSGEVDQAAPLIVAAVIMRRAWTARSPLPAMIANLTVHGRELTTNGLTDSARLSDYFFIKHELSTASHDI